jgi:hypothetical protein
MKRVIVLVLLFLFVACASSSSSKTCNSKLMRCTRLRWFCVWEDCHGVLRVGIPSKKVREANSVNLDLLEEKDK